MAFASIGLLSWLWATSHHHLVSNEQIDQLIPRELRFRPPTNQETRVLAAMTELGQEIDRHPEMRAVPLGYGVITTDPIPYSYRILAITDDLPAKVERLCNLGLPAEGRAFTVDLSGRFAGPFRALETRIALAPRRDPKVLWPAVHAIARLARTGFLYRGSTNQYLSDLSMSVQRSLMAILKAADTNLLTSEQLMELDRILPSDDEIIEAYRARLTIDFELSTTSRLRTPARDNLLRTPEPRSDGNARYLYGRLDVPMTLNREIAQAMRFIDNVGRVETQQNRARPLAETERYHFLNSRPFPSDGDPTLVVLFRDLSFRVRARAAPNARGWYVGITSYERWLEASASERATLALARAKLRILAGTGAPLPMDPGDGKPIRHDVIRNRLSSVGHHVIDPSSFGLNGSRGEYAGELSSPVGANPVRQATIGSWPLSGAR